MLILIEPWITNRLNVVPPHPRYTRAVSAFSTVSQKIVSLCKNLLEVQPAALETTSPFFLFSVYKTAALWLLVDGARKESGTAENLTTLTNTLRMMDHRWKSAGAYLQILEAREVMAMS